MNTDFMHGEDEHTLPNVAVNAIIIGADGCFILTKRVDTGLWCLPGGLVEFGETIEEATIREVREEIGVECLVESLVGIYSTNNIEVASPAKTNSIIIALKCRITQGVPSISEEVSDIGFFSAHNIPDTIIKNQRARILHALNKEGPVIQ
jgi:ADP-ribose pyrophosphatase YjhB (NUDIX family)